MARPRPFILSVVALSLSIVLTGGCKSARRDFQSAPPPIPSEVIEFAAAPWSGLDRAVDEAASEVGMAVIERDRWRLGVIYMLRTERGQPATLLVTGDPVKGATSAEARVGRFRRADLETALLEALRTTLREP